MSDPVVALTPTIAYLGPPGTYSEAAAIAYTTEQARRRGEVPLPLCPYPSIAQAIRAADQGEVDWAIVPVENSIQGSVAATLDGMWEASRLQIHMAVTLPIAHVLITHAPAVAAIQTVYSHPQALGQCQRWLKTRLPHAQLIPTNSTTEALQFSCADPTVAAIASQRAAQLYDIPILVSGISDYADNRTRFWVLGAPIPDLPPADLSPADRPPADLPPADCSPTDRPPTDRPPADLPHSVPAPVPHPAAVQAVEPRRSYTSLAFTLPANTPGALLKPLSDLAAANINLCRIESRPTKRSFGDYLFFVDLEAGPDPHDPQAGRLAIALDHLRSHAETVKTFGSYAIRDLELPAASSP
jgi:prephenate dehydratase